MGERVLSYSEKLAMMKMAFASLRSFRSMLSSIDNYAEEAAKAGVDPRIRREMIDSMVSELSGVRAGLIEQIGAINLATFQEKTVNGPDIKMEVSSFDNKVIINQYGVPCFEWATVGDKVSVNGSDRLYTISSTISFSIWFTSSDLVAGSPVSSVVLREREEGS